MGDADELRALHADIIDCLDRVKHVLVKVLARDPDPELLAELEDAMSMLGDEDS